MQRENPKYDPDLPVTSVMDWVKVKVISVEGLSAYTGQTAHYESKSITKEILQWTF